jgi:hypothetical protein
VGAALAVLAIYLLVLLAPWHQASALQHDLADLGYASSATIDLCGPATSDDSRSDNFECHVAGIAKFDFSPLGPSPIELDFALTAEAVDYSRFGAIEHPAIAQHVGQARAPPVAV